MQNWGQASLIAGEAGEKRVWQGRRGPARERKACQKTSKMPKGAASQLIYNPTEAIRSPQPYLSTLFMPRCHSKISSRYPDCTCHGASDMIAQDREYQVAGLRGNS